MLLLTKYRRNLRHRLGVEVFLDEGVSALEMTDWVNVGVMLRDRVIDSL